MTRRNPNPSPTAVDVGDILSSGTSFSMGKGQMQARPLLTPALPGHRTPSCHCRLRGIPSGNLLRMATSGSDSRLEHAQESDQSRPTAVAARAHAEAGPGWEVLRGQVEPAAVDAALRLIHLDILQNGLPSESIGLWIRSMHWFPHLK